MTTTLILGGGFGGLACARALRARLPERTHRIVVVDRARDFVVGATKTWVMLGERTADDVRRDRAALLPSGVEFVTADVTAIDVARRAAATSAGSLAGDHLVVALGAELDPGAVPGLGEGAETFYTLEGAARLRGVLERFTGGHVVLLIPRLPFMCPPGPYEASFLLEAAFRARGLRERTSLDIWTVEKAPMGTAGPEMGRMIVTQLTERGIGFHPSQKTTVVDPATRVVRFEGGEEVAYDLLIAIPPHRVPQVIVAAGLAAAGGWVPVDPATLQVAGASASGVYAIGDVAGVSLPGRWDPALPLALPKAGIFAAAEGEVVAAHIASDLAGQAAAGAFEGRGQCYIEVGGGRAMRAEGAFFQTPHPVMSARAPDEEQYRDKLAWVESWMNRPDST